MSLPPAPSAPPRSAELDHLAWSAAKDWTSAAVADGAFHGAQLALAVHGELVGTTAVGQDGSGAPLTADALIPILSLTKALTAIVVHHLHEQGHFGYDDPVAHHWPGFGQHGKEQVTVRQVMSHRSGLCPPALAGYRTWPTWHDRSSVVASVEQMRPLWAPGSRNGYQAQAYGDILNELTQRWTGLTVGEHVARFSADLPDHRVILGLPLDADVELAPLHGRVAPGQPPAGWTPPPGGEGSFFNSRHILSLGLAWGGAVATAGGVASFLSLLSPLTSRRSPGALSQATVLQALQPTNGPDDVDEVLRTRARWGLGLLVTGSEGTPATRGALFGVPSAHRAGGHLGGNSALGFVDSDDGISVALLTTGARPGVGYAGLGQAIYGCLRAAADGADQPPSQ